MSRLGLAFGRLFVEAPLPVLFVEALGEGGLNAEPGGNAPEDLEVIEP